MFKNLRILAKNVTQKQFYSTQKFQFEHAGTFQKVLMIEPDHFDVKYTINPWMGGKVDKDRARQQWMNLKNKLVGLGYDVFTMSSKFTLPDQVFVSNAALPGPVGKKVYLGNFLHDERDFERKEILHWFYTHDYEIYGDVDYGCFAGNGDCIYVNKNTIFGGFGQRSDKRVYKHIQESLEIENVIPLHLIDSRFYDLDTAFSALNDQYALYYPGAFLPKDIEEMKKHIELIPLTEEEMVNFPANLIVADKNLIFPAGNEKVMERVNKLGFNVDSVDLSEFKKAGGAAHCLHLPLPF